MFARVARRYRCCGRGAYGYVKGKLKYDPVHRYVLGLAEQEPFGNVLDLGSGRGQLGIALLEAIDSDDPSALVGLPLIRTCRMLRAAGVDLL